MKDLIEDTPVMPAPKAPNSSEGNPRAVSVRLEACPMSRAKGARNHDYRRGQIPAYVDVARICENRVLLNLRPLGQIQNENKLLRVRVGRKRAMKSNAAVVSWGIITFGTEAARMFEALSNDAQDAAFEELSQAIALRLNTTLESLVIHLDETTIHAHFMLRSYDEDGQALSVKMKAATTSELQDIAAEVMARHCPGIERGHRKRDRLAAGASYADTLHRSVRKLHQDLPVEIAAREASLEALQAEEAALAASIEKTRAHLAALSAKAVLNEKEKKRLRTYALRLAEKEKDLAAVAQDLGLRRQQVVAAGKKVRAAQARLHDVAAELDSEKRNVERAGRDAERALRAAREQAERAEAREAEATAKQAQAEATLNAFETVVEELGNGTLRLRDEETLSMKSPSVLRDLAKPLRDRIMKPVIDLLYFVDETRKRAAEVTRLRARLKAFLARDDLTTEARQEGEEIVRDWGPQ